MHPDSDFDPKAPRPTNEADLRKDLELDKVLSAMAAGDRFLFDIADAALLHPLSDPGTIRYRQDVLADCLEHPEIVRALYQLALDALEGERQHWGWGREYPETILSRALKVIEFFVTQLQELRAFAATHRRDIASDGFTRFFGMLEEELSDEYFGIVRTQLERLAFKDGTLISARLGQGGKGTDYVLRLAPQLTWRDRLAGLRRPAHSFDIHPRDEASANALSLLRSRGINHAANALAQSADHIKSFYLALATELAFYVAALNLHEHLAQIGAVSCRPTPKDEGFPRLETEQLYDLSLAIKLKTAIVGNNVEADGKQLVIVTGANQGGKSTFLRGFGLAQLMMQAGLFVAANAFSADVRDQVFTHYKREEDASMESGKLDEELARMGELSKELTPSSLLLCNESFASTNEREGSEIARQVASAVTEAGVKLVFVTHLFDFADTIRRQQRDDVLFLRAPRGEDGQRSYQLVEADPLPTSYGADTYKEVFGLR
jgi:hypothetical protein